MDKKYKNEDLKTVVEHEIKDSSHKSNRNVHEVMNGMAPNLDEMKQLGKDMDGMKTNKTLKQEGLVPDPQQDEEYER
ncbi:hypothetical protein MJA45_05460 [Paenibacillus aurantius]|uniref:Uncharacterized protein n=1 Tax=Paenibacillus aurantius TaxID=2918900 RepID=A0AA96LG91_9BACL|nr:hypothetical protein [Paenibacillus aurantius]WJH37169.1 hypothetical protein N6H14_16845 [Paenibacillus sp. CC-CFT747]WNQ12483.1 hypothetical protein MJA45_05460 [Paenibacillus aurantius]